MFICDCSAKWETIAMPFPSAIVSHWVHWSQCLYAIIEPSGKLLQCHSHCNVLCSIRRHIWEQRNFKKMTIYFKKINHKNKKRNRKGILIWGMLWSRVRDPAKFGNWDRISSAKPQWGDTCRSAECFGGACPPRVRNKIGHGPSPISSRLACSFRLRFWFRFMRMALQ